jgi:nucleotide-binding universal stress UspA family protein
MPSVATLKGTALKRIVFGTDFSPVAEKAATYARGLALSFSATVDVVHVFDTDLFLDDAEPRLRTFDERLGVRSKRLEALGATFSGMGIRTKTELRVAQPSWTGLLKAAEEDNADLILVATRSKAQLKRLFVGSTVEELIRHSAQPVLTVGPHVAPMEDGPLRFKRIVYATDFTPEAEKTAECALSFAAHDGATVYACHVIDCRANPPELAAAAEGDVRENLERLIAESSLGAYGCELTIAYGAPAQAILSLAEKVRADLIVLGPRRHSFWLTHVKRGVSLNVLAHARCPVLTVH